MMGSMQSTCCTRKHVGSSRALCTRGPQEPWRCWHSCQLKAVWPARRSRSTRSRRAHRLQSCVPHPAATFVQSNSASKAEEVAVLVRVHGGTTDAMLQRHVGWAAQLCQRQVVHVESSAAKFWVLIDETHDRSATRQRFESFAASAGLSDRQVRCFVYCEADLERAYPVLSELRQALPKSKEVQDCFSLPCCKSLAWGFHTESVLFWWSQVANTLPTLESVWVIEDDAGFSGDLSTFVDAYAHGTADLLTSGLRPVEDGWVWSDTVSRGFSSALKERKLRRWRCAEHVQRFSLPFLRMLHTFCLQRVSAWSEMAVPTLCMLVGMKVGCLREEHIGSVFTFSGRVSEDVWCLYLSEVSFRNRWWHALKW
eukprot:TRINITY_DN72519_c0_g1_i1.p1 TRINITY_DN72519_c0_g1~~TRINITY_DN72519_c0_g1_i1.p1  ORF type:complete len:406 (-),score=21.06 TRINITY_DN72519_c0_g1_i1:64-1167(-)